jgi:putative ABC transport system permease protein
MRRFRSGAAVDTLRMAFDNLRAHRLRSGLTVVGVVIGVLVVVVVSSILTGMRRNVIEAVEEYGTNNIFAFHLTTGPQLGPRDRSEFRRKPLRPEDGRAVRDLAPAVQDVAHCAFMWLPDRTIAYGREKYRRGDLQAVSANYAEIANLSLREGRFLTEADDAHRRSVMVIGHNVAQALFGTLGGRGVGREVRFAGRPFAVIGVLEKRKGGFMGENEDDNAVFMPYRTGRIVAPTSSDWMLLVIRARSGQLPVALDQVEDILRRRRGVRANEPANFDLSTADRIIQQFDGITATIGLIAISISSVSLLVGGIGVMNIMLVSVTERTQEIGVRKALGARRRDIVRQFLFEAIALTASGGVVGVVLAVLVSRLLLWLLPALPSEIPPWAVVAGLAVSTGVGLGFGVWPARRAAALDPVEALRYE